MNSAQDIFGRIGGDLLLEVFYAVAESHLPTAAVPSNCSNCLTVNGAGQYAAVLLFSGQRMAALAQVRNAPPTDADTKQNTANYLEGNNAANIPGPGTLLTSMTADELIDQLEKNLDAVPNIKGVNNHMGSRMTAESSQMYQIFTILKKKGLFFIDSRTTNASLCKPSARLFQIPFAQRDVFLDHLQEPDFIRKQIKELIKIARRHGHAVGIGHAHAVTYKILRDMLPDLNNEVQLVPASEIVSPVG